MATMAGVKALNIRKGGRALDKCQDYYGYCKAAPDPHDPADHTSAGLQALFEDRVKNVEVTLFGVPGMAYLYKDDSILYLPDAGWGRDDDARVVTRKVDKVAVEDAFDAAIGAAGLSVNAKKEAELSAAKKSLAFVNSENKKYIKRKGGIERLSYDESRYCHNNIRAAKIRLARARTAVRKLGLPVD